MWPARKLDAAVLEGFLCSHEKVSIFVPTTSLVAITTKLLTSLFELQNLMVNRTTMGGCLEETTAGEELGRF